MSMIPAGTWARISPNGREPGDSLQHHGIRCRSHAQANNQNVVREYTLDVSGRDVINTPEGQRMLADVRAGVIKALICSTLYRLVRNAKQALEILDIFDAAGARLVFLDLNIDTGTPSGRAIFTIIAALGQAEREESANRVAASVPVRAQLGKPTGGAAPYGYQWVDRKLIPHPEEKHIRRLIYELFAEHKRCRTVARILTERGYKTRKSQPFADVTIRKLIQDPTAKGQRRANYTQSRYRSKTGERKPESEWIYFEVEAIVPAALWDRCNQILSAKSESRSKKARYPFSGVLFCSCGGKMYCDGGSKRRIQRKYRCIACHSAIEEAALEEVASTCFQNFFRNPDTLNSLVRDLHDTLKHKRDLLAGRRRELDKTVRAIAAAEQDYIDCELSGSRYDALSKRLEDRGNSLHAEIETVTAEINALEQHLLSSEQAMDNAQAAFLRWDAFTAQEKHDLLRQTVEWMQLDGDHLLIQLSYWPGVFQAEQRAQGGPAETSNNPVGLVDHLTRLIEPIRKSPKPPRRKRHASILVALIGLLLGTAAQSLGLSAGPGQGQAWA